MQELLVHSEGWPYPEKVCLKAAIFLSWAPAVIEPHASDIQSTLEGEMSGDLAGFFEEIFMESGGDTSCTAYKIQGVIGLTSRGTRFWCKTPDKCLSDTVKAIKAATARLKTVLPPGPER